MSLAVVQTRRVNAGKGHKYLLDGEEADGVTTVISNGVAKPALVGWAANVTRDYAVDHWDELSQVALSERIKQLSKARFADRDAAAGRGTQVHQIAWHLSHGETVEVPEELEGHVDAYLQFIREWKPEELFAEMVVGSRKHRYMGTLDLVARLGDVTWLIDFKTTRSGIYPEAALQLAAYAHAEFMLDADGVESPMVPVERAGCIWLRADGYDLVPVDTSEATFRTFLYARELAHFTTADRGVYVGEALTPPAVAA